LIVVYYSSLWKPLMRLASALGIRKKQPEMNWLAHEDVKNLLNLADYEPIHLEQRILLPVYIPLVSYVLNKFLAPLPIVRNFALVNLLVARPGAPSAGGSPAVSVIVPARNEAGNLAELAERVPLMGPNDELIFVEGHSSDHTWDVIQQIYDQRGSRRMQIAQQDGKGKGDAVRKGFAMAKGDVLMILDADLSVDPEELPKFYDAIRTGKGEFVNGSRLVYPMEAKAMRFLNMLANKFFAVAFSFVLGQRFKDTLCGTKVVSRSQYEKIAQHRSFFGDFDPFGDFDLLFGAARLSLKIVEVPVPYKERTYGTTNISRFRHGALLFRMLWFALFKFKFI
jgi:glycosyltransferase involved in cell wall biosynthesis